MTKRGSQDIKKLILKILDKEGNLTFAQLERKLNTGFRTIKANCEELEEFGAVSIIKKEKHEATGRAYFLVSITAQGRKILEK